MYLHDRDFINPQKQVQLQVARALSEIQYLAFETEARRYYFFKCLRGKSNAAPLPKEDFETLKTLKYRMKIHHEKEIEPNSLEIMSLIMMISNQPQKGLYMNER